MTLCGAVMLIVLGILAWGLWLMWRTGK